MSSIPIRPSLQLRALAAQLEAPEIHTRLEAVRALETSPLPGAGAALIRALDDSEGWVRQRAAEALGQRRERSAVGPLCAALEDPWTRTFAARALGQIGDTAAVAALTGALGDPGAGSLPAIIDALAAIGDSGAVGAIEQAALYGTPWVAEAADEALAILGAPPAERRAA